MAVNTSNAHANSSTVPVKWDATHMPSLVGKLAIVTGANSGIGFATAQALALQGAHVALACRSPERGAAALAAIQHALTQECGERAAGCAELQLLDASDLGSVHRFVTEFRSKHDHLDILINNAGVMPVAYTESVDGFEMQFATNHLGHFALTARLIDLLQRSIDGRVVCITSLSHRNARLNLEQLVWPKHLRYDQQTVYANTKLYKLLFAQELDRRLKACGVAHSSTRLIRALFRCVSTIAQTPEMGILPTLRLHNMWGYPVVETPQNAGVTAEAARALWERSEVLAELTFTIV